MPLRYELLQLIVNPTVAFLLLTIGVIGLAIELFSPGTFRRAGSGSSRCCWGSTAPRNPGPDHGDPAAGAGGAADRRGPPGHRRVLGLAGIGALIASSLLLYDTDSDAFGVSPPIVVAAAALLGALLAFVVQRVVAAHQDAARTGWEEMVGAVGEVRAPLDPVGQVFVEGALWRAIPPPTRRRSP